MKRLLNLLLCACFFLSNNSHSQEKEVVGAAADLKFALEEVYANFHKETGKSIKFNFGSSGNLYHQILNGAPFGLFMSADQLYVDKLIDAGFTMNNGNLYAIGRIVLVKPKDSPLTLSTSKDQLLTSIKKVNKFSIANPDHAPYGKAAKEFLTNLGVWDEVREKLVVGENISQATVFVGTGNAHLGVSALSLVSAPNIGSKVDYILIPDKLHKPLNQKMVLMKNSSKTIQEFYTYIRSPASTEILKRYGFTVPK